MINATEIKATEIKTGVWTPSRVDAVSASMLAAMGPVRGPVRESVPTAASVRESVPTAASVRSCFGL